VQRRRSFIGERQSLSAREPSATTKSSRRVAARTSGRHSKRQPPNDIGRLEPDDLEPSGLDGRKARASPAACSLSHPGQSSRRTSSRMEASWKRQTATNGSRITPPTPQNRPKSLNLTTDGNTPLQTGQTSHARGRRFETRRAHQGTACTRALSAFRQTHRRGARRLPFQSVGHYWPKPRIHDIFLPYEYPKDWVVDERRAWAEQYLLQAFLALNTNFEVVIPNYAVARAERFFFRVHLRDPQRAVGMEPFMELETSDATRSKLTQYAREPARYVGIAPPRRHPRSGSRIRLAAGISSRRRRPICSGARSAPSSQE
jgi:hypothetical protein